MIEGYSTDVLMLMRKTGRLYWMTLVLTLPNLETTDTTLFFTWSLPPRELRSSTLELTTRPGMSLLMKPSIKTISYRKRTKDTPDFSSSTIVKTLMAKSSDASNKSSTSSDTRLEPASTKSTCLRRRMVNRIHRPPSLLSLAIELVLR